MTRLAFGKIIKTFIISAFTIATALIWKDVISHAIEKFVPAKDFLFYELLAAVVSTVIILVLLYFILKTEDEAELVFRGLKKKKVRR